MCHGLLAPLCTLALTLAPLGARAEPPDEPPDAEQPEFEPPLEDVEEPIEIVPPEPEPVPVPVELEPPMPEPPLETPPDEVIPLAFRPPTPEERARGHALRKTGIGLMAGGGAVAVAGFGLTLAYTIVGDQRESAQTPMLGEIEQAARVAQVGGVLLASGIAIVAAGGIIYVRGKRQLDPRPVAQLRVTPAFGGLVVSGRF